MEIQLSRRLLTLADMVPEGAVVCDVGCDHGFLSIALVQQGRCNRCIAMDVRKGPLSSAAAHIAECGLTEQIQARLSDGLAALAPGEATTVICAGMGGRLMQRILAEGNPSGKKVKEVILQPQSEIPQFRAYLREGGYELLAEDMVLEDGKFYPMMKCRVPEEGRSGRTFSPERVRQECFDDSEVRCEQANALSEEKAGMHEPGLKQNHTGGAAYESAIQMLTQTLSISEMDAACLCDLYGPMLLQNRHPVLKAYLEKGRNSLQELLASIPEDAHTDRIHELREERRLNQIALDWYRV